MTTATTTAFINFTNLVDATYSFRVFANDSYGNFNVSESRTIIISQGAPVIFIDSPLNLTYNTNDLTMNVRASKDIQSWWFVLNGENFTLTPNITFAAAFDYNTLEVFAQDLVGNVGSSSVNFSVNESEWLDNFGSYAGLNQSTFLQVGSGASMLSCWPMFFDTTTPQQNPANCWQYRRALNLSTSSSLTDYEVKLDIDLSADVSAGRAQASCDDMRFSYANNTGDADSVVPYWIESCDSGNATVWVNLPTVTTNSVVYVYFGNNFSEREEEPVDVFTIFDEFDVMNTSTWGANAANWDSEASEGFPTVAGASSQLTATSAFPGAIHGTELWIRGNSTSGSAGYYDVGNSAGTKYLRLFIDPASNRINVFNGANNFYTVNMSQTQKITLLTDFTNDNYSIFVNGESALNLTSAANANRQNGRLYSFFNRGLFVDRIAVHKHDTSNPVVETVGSFETPLVNATLRSELLLPTPIGEWDVFSAETTLPANTDIVFRVLNASGDSLCGNLSNAQVTGGYDLCPLVTNQSLYLEADLITTGSSYPTLHNWSVNWTETANFSFADLIIERISFSNETPISGEVITIQVNITNNGSATASNFGVQVNVTNMTASPVLIDNTTSITLAAGASYLVNTSWIVESGTFNITTYVDYTAAVAEDEETNNNASARFTVSSYQTFYGNSNLQISLASAVNENVFNWTNGNDGVFYYADADSSFFPFNLAILDVAAGDLADADTTLGLSLFDDSLANLYDADGNNAADLTVNRIVGGSVLNNIPVINSTNSSTFVTGILYDTADGFGYDGSQDLVFVTWTNASQVGQFGTYDFEIKVPANLERLTGVTDAINQYFEQE